MRLTSLCYTAVKLAGLTALARRLRRGGVIFCYHNVVAESDGRSWDEGGLHMPFSSFERQMRWLAARYEVVPLAEFADRLARAGSLRGVAALTFDDGYGGVFEHAWPLLRALSMPATVFVVAHAPGRDDGFWWDHPDVLRAYSPARRRHWLTALRGDGAAVLESLASPRTPALPPPCRRPASWDTITEAVRSGLGIGVHSATHRSLPALHEGDLSLEVVESRDIIARRTGVLPQFFAYPYGLWNDRVRRAVRAAGYRAAFTLDDGCNTPATDSWALRRVNVPAGISDGAFEVWAAGLNLGHRHAS